MKRSIRFPYNSFGSRRDNIQVSGRDLRELMKIEKKGLEGGIIKNRITNLPMQTR